jgi:hypothetical protein
MPALSVIRAGAQVKLRDQNQRILTNAQIDVLINDALEKIASITEEVRRENAFTVTAKQYIYTAPTDIITPITANWMPVLNGEIEVISHDEFVQRGGYDLRITGSIPRFLTTEGQQGAYTFRLFPPPGASSASSTLNGAITDAAATSITVTDGAQFRSPSGWVIIDSEKILYQNVSATQLLLCRRGVGGTTAATHLTAATVTQCDFHVYYSRRPDVLTADGDIPVIDDRWHECLEDYVAAIGYALDGRGNDAAQFEARWQRHLHDARVSVRRQQGAQPRMILPGGY